MLDVVPSRDATNVAAVVLNWNGWRDTVECLESLLASSRRPAHIVVCDNGSADGSLAFLKQWAATSGIAFESFDSPADALASPYHGATLTFIQNGENGGFAAGNNVGLRYLLERTRAEYCWLLNNDAVVSPGALEAMLELAQEDPKAGMIGCTLVNYDDPTVVQAVGGGRILPILCHDTQLGHGKRRRAGAKRRIELDHLIGACLLVRTEAIRDVGLMDETYFLYREETDWCIRMRRNGWRLYCRPDATVRHKQARSIGFKSPTHDYYAVRNILRLVRKFFPKSLPVAFTYFAMRSLLPKILRLQFGRALAVCAALRDFVAGVDGRAKVHTDATIHAHYVAPIADKAIDARVVRRAVAVIVAFVLVGTIVLGRFTIASSRHALSQRTQPLTDARTLVQRPSPGDQGN